MLLRDRIAPLLLFPLNGFLNLLVSDVLLKFSFFGFGLGILLVLVQSKWGLADGHFDVLDLIKWILEGVCELSFLHGLSYCLFD